MATAHDGTDKTLSGTLPKIRSSLRRLSREVVLVIHLEDRNGPEALGEAVGMALKTRTEDDEL